MALFAATLSACGVHEPGSWLTVHNRTSVPVVAVEEYNDSSWLVDACASREFRIVGRGPAPTTPDDRDDLPPEAIDVPVSAVGPADASSRTVVVVTADGTYEYVSDPPASLPPCEGQPAAPNP